MNYRQCTANSKRTHQRCKGRAVNGSEVCYFHGGRTPKGIASPHFKHGRYTPHLLPQLREQYEKFKGDDELLSLTDEIALVDTLLSENLSALQTGESSEFWDAALSQVIDARKAYKSESFGGLEKALDELEALCDRRRLHFAAEKEIREKIDLRRKLTESRRKHMIEAQEVVTAEQAMVLVSGLLESVRRNVTDRATLTAINADFILLTTGQNHQRVSSGDDPTD